MLDAFFEGPQELDRMGHRPARHVGAPGGPGQFAHVKGGFQVPVRRGLGPPLERSRGSDLATGHPVDSVVDHDHREVDVSPGGVDEMVSPDAHAVPVSGEDDDLSSGIGKL